MSWHVFVYRTTSENIVYALELEENAGVPPDVFDDISDDGELEAYYRYVSEDNKIRWGMWRKTRGEWIRPESIPDALKVAEYLL